MSSFFNFDRDVVYAPGMTCIYDQLFDGIFAHRWKAYPFRQQEFGFCLYDEPSVVIENLFKGETKQSATLFADPARFLHENGKAVEYDILVIESRWLFYESFLFAEIDWDELRLRLAPYRKRRLVFLDCHYPHYGYLQNIYLIRNITKEELYHHRRWQTTRHHLLEIFTDFNHFRYISVDALAAYQGYQTACMDQPDHYQLSFRETFKNLLESYSEDRHYSNVLGFVSVENMVTDRESEIELIEGMREAFKAKEVILKLRIRVKANDPILCDTEIRAIWISQVEGTIAWRQNFRVNKDSIIHPILNASDQNNNKTLLKSFDDLIKISTFNRYEFTVLR